MNKNTSRKMHTVWSLTCEKSSKFDVTRCQILRLKCTKFDFHWGSAPDPCWGSLQRSPDLLTVVKGPTCKGREGVERKGEMKGRGERGQDVLAVFKGLLLIGGRG